MTLTKETLEKLRAPFAVSNIKIKMQTQPKEGETGKALCVAYIDSRDVMDRLDEVCEGDWMDFYSTGIAGGVECRLTVMNVTRSDVGTSDDNEKEKSAYSDAFKRAAVKFGIGRFLYDLPKMWAECTKSGKYWNMNKGEMERLQGQILSYLNSHPDLIAQVPQKQAQKPVEQKTEQKESSNADATDGLVTPKLIVELKLSEDIASAAKIINKLHIAGKLASAENIAIMRKYRAAKDGGMTTDQAVAEALK